MEESKELQGFYRIFRAVIYISVLMEFFEYAVDPALLDHWGGITRGHPRPYQTVDDIQRRSSCVQQGCDRRAYLHHLHWHAQQETYRVRCPPAGALSVDGRSDAACPLGVALQPSDAGTLLLPASEYHLLYARLRCRGRAGTYRIGQHLQVP